MANIITATLPASFAKEGQGTTPLAVDTISEFTAANGVTIDKAVTFSAGIASTGGLTATTGGVTVTAGNLTFNGTSQKLIQPTTSLLVRDHADANTNITVLDNGNTTFRGDLAAVNGTFSGTVTAAGVTAVTPIAAVTADGAITIAAQNKIYMITKAGVAAMTIADPTATTHDGVVLVFVAATANAHTLSNAAGSGFFSSGGASKDVATFGGAIGDGLAIIAYQGKWYIDPRGVTNITLG